MLLIESISKTTRLPSLFDNIRTLMEIGLAIKATNLPSIFSGYFRSASLARLWKVIRICYLSWNFSPRTPTQSCINHLPHKAPIRAAQALTCVEREIRRITGGIGNSDDRDMVGDTGREPRVNAT